MCICLPDTGVLLKEHLTLRCECSRARLYNTVTSGVYDRVGEVAGGGDKCTRCEMCNCYSLPDIRVIKQGGLEWVGHVVRLGT